MIALRRLRYRSAITTEVLRSPSVELHLSNTRAARRRHAELTARQRKWLPNAGFGAALMPVPMSMDDYLAGSSRALLRRKRRRALAAGFRFTEFQGPNHVGDMLAIHRSSDVRQRQPMLRAYLDEPDTRLYAERAGTLLGVIDKSGAVRAYAHVEVHGEVGSFQRLIGHADVLENGAVYLLASETVGYFIDLAQETTQPRWLMCGNLWGNGEGLAYFKRRVGFMPFRARFAADEPAAQTSP